MPQSLWSLNKENIASVRRPPVSLAPSLVAIPLLAILPTFFLWQLLLTNRILVGLDVFNYFYPYHDFAAAMWATGRLPLWNPFLFLGVPFLADSQAQVLYPPAWPLLWFEAPRALALALALHLALAGVGAWLLAQRALRFAPLGAFVTASIFALGGYLGSLAEHPNQLAAAAWLPWLLLGGAIAETRRRQGIVLVALALALSFLAGHAQTTFISLVALGLWALFRPVRLLLVIPGALLGVGIAAVQLLPMAELSGLSIRSDGLSYREAVSFSFDPRLWPRALLPTFGLDERILSEFVAYVGFSGLLLALLGVIFFRRDRVSFWALSLAGAGLFLAPAVINPFYPLLWRVIPGIGLFRAPARWLLLYVLGVAVLAGLGADWLVARDRPLTRSLWRRIGTVLGLVVALAAASLIVADLPESTVWPVWLVAVPAALSLLLVPRVRRRWRAVFIGCILLGELFAASNGLDFNRATAPEAYSALRPAPAHLLTMQPGVGRSRVLSTSDLTWDPGDLTDLVARHADRLSPDAVYDLVVAIKLKEVVAPNQPMRWGLYSADGYGGGVLPLQSYTILQSFLPLTKVVPDGRLRERLTSVPSARWLDLLGVEWIVADKVRDLWVGGIYHDLGVPREVGAGEALVWKLDPPFPADSLSLVAGGLPADGMVAEIRIDGQPWTPVDATALQNVRDDWRQGVVALPSAGDGAVELVETVELRVPRRVGSWVLGGLTVVNSRLGTFEPLPADPAFQTTLSGDVKVYRRLSSPGRAWIVPEALIAPSGDVAALLRSATFDPRREVIVAADSTAGEFLDTVEEALSAGRVLWLDDDPHQLILRVESDGAGWLVVADNWYPGWQATIDGTTVAIHRANLYARAVRIPGAGTHLVRFVYKPKTLLLGAFISIAALLVVLTVALWSVMDHGGPAGIGRNVTILLE